MTKYIVIEGNFREMIIFGDSREHRSVAEQFKFNSIVSAGFLSIGIGPDGNPAVSAYGESVSLGLKSDIEKDTKLAKRTLDLE